MMALRSRLINELGHRRRPRTRKYAALKKLASDRHRSNPMTGVNGVGVVPIGNSEVYSHLQGRQ